MTISGYLPSSRSRLKTLMMTLKLDDEEFTGQYLLWHVVVNDQSLGDMREIIGHRC